VLNVTVVRKYDDMVDYMGEICVSSAEAKSSSPQDQTRIVAVEQQ